MKKVMVLEDESSIRSFIVINLRRAGYEVVEAESGEEALDRLDRKLEQTMRAVEASYEKNKERWVDTLFSLIVGVQP